ncbi:hypothetical protein FEM48_ZijujMtG0000600 (mitochondrion) [Ziziphus jujuba var. spinosa]|uniref:Uncharacterized protein n=1 Tax=Ziziphus jujuba var. spinosa TaxID=714518 RepID=A0A978UA59_ZIZJJ|nr:hypothetical protein FEM48_ZijujMtG0000600 [Ziziphus jujuba var. spinosa]
MLEGAKSMGAGAATIASAGAAVDSSQCSFYRKSKIQPMKRRFESLQSIYARTEELQASASSSQDTVHEEALCTPLFDLNCPTLSPPGLGKRGLRILVGMFLHPQNLPQKLPIFIFTTFFRQKRRWRWIQSKDRSKKKSLTLRKIRGSSCITRRPMYWASGCTENHQIRPLCMEFCMTSERDHRSIAQDRLFLLPWGRPVNKRKGKGATYLTNNKKGGEIGDRIRRPEATSSRGRSLALAAYRLATRLDKGKLQRLLRSKILALTLS